MPHKTEAELLAELEKAGELIQTGGKYAHYKDTNHTYEALGFAIIEATDEIGVRYKANYGAGLEFVRPVQVWLQNVEWQGESVPRFKKLS